MKRKKAKKIDIVFAGWGTFDFDEFIKLRHEGKPQKQRLLSEDGSDGVPDSEYGDDDPVDVRDEAEKILIGEIRKHGYWFAGEDHQYANNCCPVFKYKGKPYYFSTTWRCWGRVMTSAHSTGGESYSYLDFYMSLADSPKYKVPEQSEWYAEEKE